MRFDYVWRDDWHVVLVKAPENNPVLDAARRRAKRNKPERARMAAFRAAVADIETIGNGIATAQTLVEVALRRRNESPLARLKRTNRLNVWEESAADEIVRAHTIRQGASTERNGTDWWDTTSSPDAGAVHRIDAVDKYRDWLSDLRMTEVLYVCRDVLIEEMSLRALDRSNRWPDGTAYGHLLAGLRHFAALRGNTPRGVKWRYTA